MKAMGRPIARSSLYEIEGCRKQLSLDDAFALTEALEAVPLFMLTPPAEKYLRLSDSVATEAAGVSDWLLYGLPDSQPPECAR
jgi:hypothetical protein